VGVRGGLPAEASIARVHLACGLQNSEIRAGFRGIGRKKSRKRKHIWDPDERIERSRWEEEDALARRGGDDPPRTAARWEEEVEASSGDLKARERRQGVRSGGGCRCRDKDCGGRQKR
jgi:hypothetical protein